MGRVLIIGMLWIAGCAKGSEPVIPAEGGVFDARGDRTTGTDARSDGDGSGLDLCANVMCDGFQLCDQGMCVSYPACVDRSECRAGEVCRQRFCIPEDRDPDMDGHPASTDCDETNAEINPGMAEVCNGIDDNCSDEIDEGDPGLLCAMDPSGGECIEGSCGCPGGRFDIDRLPENGCECTAEPALGDGEACEEAIDLGMVGDAGEMLMVPGNVLPDDRVVWYRFRAVDTPDTSCDNFHVRVRLVTNPADAFAFQVFRGSCGENACEDGLFTDFSWATDFTSGSGAMRRGECPCAPAPGAANRNVCNNDSNDYFVRVSRRPGSMVACDGYELEVSNGIFDTM
ncbi:MAG: putative metal-binding motif-containing protein [Myxococcota bacterium]